MDENGCERNVFLDDKEKQKLCHKAASLARGQSRF